MLGNQDEQDDASRKQVHLPTNIGFTEVNFWRHVLRSTKFSEQSSTSIPSFDWRSKAKVSNFDSVLMIHKDVFWFQVSVSDAFSMTVIKTLQNLFEVVPCHFLIKGSSIRDELKHAPSLR